MISLRVYLLILGVLGAERLFELWLSSRNAQRAFAAGAIEAGRRHYLVMVAMHALFLLACAVEAAVGQPPPAAVSWVAIAGALSAQGLRYWSVWALGEHWNTRIIVWPNAQPIIAGPYQYIRHPNYVAVAIEIAAVPMIYGCWLTALAFSAADAMILAVRIPAEERALGRSYRGVFAQRPRFIPSLRRG